MVFPVVMYGCESWTIKNAEHRRIDAFELWCWSRLLRVPWTARRFNQSILREISPGISLEEMMLKLKLQYSCLENPMDGGAWCPWGRKESDMTERLYFYFTLPTKVRLVKAMVFPVVMYGCESWTIKNAEGRRIDAFELW